MPWVPPGQARLPPAAVSRGLQCRVCCGKRDSHLLGSVVHQGASEPRRPAAPSAGWIGTDEAGKGDYFGPLVVAAVHVTPETAAILQELGVRDSKTLSDKRVTALAGEIRRSCAVRAVVVGPERYNTLYAEMANLNRLLAWAHARAIEDILGEVDCERVISDQFADEAVLRRALQQKGRRVQLDQRPRAEDDVAVAAASIVARAEFLARLARLSAAVGVDLARGAGPPVLAAGRRYVEKHGVDALVRVAKVHFRTTKQLAESAQA
jgi:ribonuclease HIII